MEHGSPSDPYEKSTWRWRAFYRSKSGVYRDDRIVHFDGDPEEFADGDTRKTRYAHSKLWTSFVENLPEGTVVTDGVAVQ
jgi:hypothetical protein